jgi:hypothetical protein
MPISDPSGYPKGHFQRVYEHIIKPACELAKFKPVRADDVLTTNHIALDIIKKIIESDMALCDLSSQNPNVLYELGVRQAFDKPVSLIKDYKTGRVFDIQGFRDIEYDENLRIDTVQGIIENLAQNITSTYEQKEEEVNSLVKLLAITPAKITEKTKISVETELILNNLETISKRLNQLENNSNYKSTNYQLKINQDKVIDENLSVFEEPYILGEKITLKELAKLKKGDKVNHMRFGIGVVKKIEGDTSNLKDLKGNIDFEVGGEKKLLLRFANLRRVL